MMVVSVAQLLPLDKDSRKFVHVTQFCDTTYVHIRAFAVSDIQEDLLVPMKTGAGLTPSEWYNLSLLSDVANAQVMALQDSSTKTFLKMVSTFHPCAYFFPVAVRVSTM